MIFLNVSRTFGILWIVDVLLQDALDEYENRVMVLAERTAIKALNTCDVDYNKALIKGALRSSLNALLLSILENESEIRDSLELTVFQVSASKMVVWKVVKADGKEL